MTRDRHKTANSSAYWRGLNDGVRGRGYNRSHWFTNREAQDYARGWSAGNARAVFKHAGRR